MAQNAFVEIPLARYTRADFAALRAYLNRIPLERVAVLYYAEGDRDDLGIVSPIGLRTRLEMLRDTLIQRASVANPHLAELLRNARRITAWSPKLVAYLVHEAEADATIPRKSDSLSVWLKPRVAIALRAEGANTVGELIVLVETRGAGWWKPIPRLGAGKAAALVAWLKKHPENLGCVDVAENSPVISSETIEIFPEMRNMLPLERISLPDFLSGRSGINQNQVFPLIAARNDLEAIEAYLYKFRTQEKTRRAYQKELERFLLWCVYERGKPMSSTMIEDCEAFKNFLADPPTEWVGTKAPRLSPQWKPFAGKLAAKSQRYAVQVIRSFFEWLRRVRYLAGNPWVAVSDPSVTTEIAPIQIHKALPAELWGKLMVTLNGLCSETDEGLRKRYRLRGAAVSLSIPAQFRVARAALLLMGDGGLRREEVAGALRCNLRSSTEAKDLWELDVLGKRNKWRTIFVPRRVVEAIEAHWADLGGKLDFPPPTMTLLSPIVQLGTESFIRKHGAEGDTRKHCGFSADGIYQLVKTSLLRIANDDPSMFGLDEREILRGTACHAFRHTFGISAIEREVPIDVLQGVFGHASVQTTSVYIQAPKKRAAREIGKFFRQ